MARFYPLAIVAVCLAGEAAARGGESRSLGAWGLALVLVVPGLLAMWLGLHRTLFIFIVCGVVGSLILRFT